MGNSKEKSDPSEFQQAVSLRLRDAFDKRNLTGAALSKESAFASSTVNNWLNGKTSPSAEFLAHLQNLGFDVPYILSGQRSIQAVPNDAMDSPAHIAAESVPTSYRVKRPLTGQAPKPQSDEDTIYIPLLSATGSMGPGSDLVTADVVMGDVPVSRLWLQMNLPRHRPQALRLVHAYGDSMRGTLDSGDFALVDTDVHTIAIDGVYVLEAHDRLFIKRVRQRMDGQYEVSSDNPSIKQTDVLDGDHQIRICGMVVYGWNGRRF